MSIKVDVNKDYRVEEVWLGEDGPYDFLVPKVALLSEAARRSENLDEETRSVILLNAQMRWLAQGFGEDWARIEARLSDENDILDVPHLTQVFAAITEEVSARPTISPRDHLPPRRARVSTAEPSRMASESES